MIWVATAALAGCFTPLLFFIKYFAVAKSRRRNLEIPQGALADVVRLLNVTVSADLSFVVLQNTHAP